MSISKTDKEITRKIEDQYPECTDKLYSNFEKAYTLFCKKQDDYGDSNIRLGLDISSKNSSLCSQNRALAQLGIVIRMNDKIQRLINVYKKSTLDGEGLSVRDESIEDTCLDLMNYANMLMILREGKWGR